jgi:hypothetical protein
MTLQQWEEICKKVYGNERKLWDNKETLSITYSEMDMFHKGIIQTMQIIREHLFGKVEI